MLRLQMRLQEEQAAKDAFVDSVAIFTERCKSTIAIMLERRDHPALATGSR